MAYSTLKIETLRIDWLACTGKVYQISVGGGSNERSFATLFYYLALHYALDSTSVDISIHGVTQKFWLDFRSELAWESSSWPNKFDGTREYRKYPDLRRQTVDHRPWRIWSDHLQAPVSRRPCWKLDSGLFLPTTTWNSFTSLSKLWRERRSLLGKFHK